MQLIKIILYNASMISFLNELYKKYPHPFVIHDSIPRTNIDIYQTLTAIDIQWKSKGLDYRGFADDQNIKEINSVHLFCTNEILDSIYTITINILRNSNSFKIQNLILLNPYGAKAVKSDVFAKHERLQRNTLICEHDTLNITCWRWVNKRERILKPTLTDLLYEPLDLNLSEIQIAANAAPPNSFFPCFSGRYVFSGLDAMVTAEILSKVNATPKYCNKMLSRQLQTGSCNKIDKINDDEAVKLIRELKSNEKSALTHIFYHTIFDSKMIKYLFYGRAECTGPYDIKMNTGDVSLGHNINGLTPSEFSCILIIIPRANAASSFIRRIFYNSVESIGFICTVLIFTIGRIVISKSPFTQWFNVTYSTFMVFLSQTTLTPKTCAERIIYAFLLGSSVFTTVMLSSLIFTSLINNPSSKSIRTMDDLAESNFTIRALNNTWMDNIREDIRKKIVIVDYNVIVQSMNTMDTSTAFAINENLFNLLRKLSNLDYKLHDVYYEIAEKIHCGYSSYKMSSSFPLKNYVNQIIQSLIENGLISAFKKWSNHIMKLSFTKLFTLKNLNDPISLTNISGVFEAYMIGVFVSLFALFGEILVKHFSAERLVEA